MVFVIEPFRLLKKCSSNTPYASISAASDYPDTSTRRFRGLFADHVVRSGCTHLTLCSRMVRIQPIAQAAYANQIKVGKEYQDFVRDQGLWRGRTFFARSDNAPRS